MNICFDPHRPRFLPLRPSSSGSGLGIPSVSTELLRVVKFSVLGIFELLNFWQILSTAACKPVAYKKNRV